MCDLGSEFGFCGLGLGLMAHRRIHKLLEAFPYILMQVLRRPDTEPQDNDDRTTPPLQPVRALRRPSFFLQDRP